MYKVRLILIVTSMVFISNCSSPIDVRPETFLELKNVWIMPTSESCEKFGGYYGKEYKVCEGSLEEAKLICDANNAVVPSIDDYLLMSRECGALQIQTDDEFESNDERKLSKRVNANNQSYQTCIEKLGFYPFGDYFSSSLQNTKIVKTICHNGNCTRYVHSIKNPTEYKIFTVYHAEIINQEQTSQQFIACKR